MLLVFWGISLLVARLTRALLVRRNVNTLLQEIGARILMDHPAVLSEPESWVLVDELAASTVNIRFYFWVDGSKHNLFKVESSVLRLVKTS